MQQLLDSPTKLFDQRSQHSTHSIWRCALRHRFNTTQHCIIFFSYFFFFFHWAKRAIYNFYDCLLTFKSQQPVVGTGALSRASRALSWISYDDDDVEITRVVGIRSIYFHFQYAHTQCIYRWRFNTIFTLLFYSTSLHSLKFFVVPFQVLSLLRSSLCGSACVSFGLSTVWCVALVGVFRFFLRFQSFWKFPIQYFVFAHRSQFLWSCRCRKMLSRIVAEFTWVLLSFFLLSVYDFGPFSVSTRARVRKSELNN